MTENHAEKAMKNIQETANKLMNQSNDYAILGKDKNDIKSNEWYEMYGDVSTKLESQLEENKKLQEDLLRRQDRYVKREQDYRKHIDDLQRELRVRFGYEDQAYVKNEATIKFLKEQMIQNIEGIQPKTKKLKEEQEKDIVRKFNSELSKMKKKIEERKSQKGDQAADLKDRENELHHHLELITNIAQRIDNENRALMKKNQELKSEYKAQENDRELLVKQLVMQKKENAKIREEIDFYERIIEEREDDEDLDVDRIDTVSHAQKAFQQSRFTEPKGLYNVEKNKIQNQRSQLNTRGTNRSNSNQQQQAPLVYIPQKKVETEEEKIKRYERVVEKLKKMLDHERKNLRQSRFAYQREMSQKTELEHLLRETVDQVKNEKKQQRLQSATHKFSVPSLGHELYDNSDLNQQERERVIELLLSQERVIALLYEKTFPMTSSDPTKLNYGQDMQNINIEQNKDGQDRSDDI